MRTDILPGLVIPVDVAALCVGTIDQQDAKEGTSTFAGATTYFTDQTGKNQAFLGSNVTRSFHQSPWLQLKTGIHLHWALPQALTHGAQQEGGDLTFPTAPNRWLVSRIIVNGTTLTRNSWVIESDHLTEKVEGKKAITLPVKTLTETEQNYRYIGRHVVFDAAWKEPDRRDQFKALTGADLSAVSNGQASFAAFYPDCNSVFGFYDTMADVVVKGKDTVNVMYQVTGWYSNIDNDPLKNGKTVEQLQDLYNWTFENETPGAAPAYSLYSGLIQDIGWSPDKTYIVGQPMQQPIEAVVTVGNTPPQTFSAYFKEALFPLQPFFEQLFDAFQQGLLESFQQPAADQWARLEEALHQDEFSNQQSGSVYLIVVKNERNEEVPAGDLPVALGDALNLLNFYRQQLDEYALYVQNFQWELFSDWYRLMKSTDIASRNNLNAQLLKMVSVDWKGIQQKYEAYRSLHDAQKVTVESQVISFNQDYKLKSIDAPRYWQPSEPVVLITAEPHPQQKVRYGKVLFIAEDGYLFCRLTSQMLTGIRVNNIAIAATDFSAIRFPHPNHLPYPDPCNALLLESVLLNTALVSAISGTPVAALAVTLKAALERIVQTVYTFTGVLPAKDAVLWWDGNTWSPVFLEWTAYFYPLQNTERNGVLEDYTPEFFIDNYDISTNVGGRVSYDGATDPAKIDFVEAPVYTGGAIMATSAAQSLNKQLAAYLKDHTDPKLQEIVMALDEELFFAQALNGFTSQLSMQEQQVQLNIKASPDNPYIFLTAAVAEIAGQFAKVSPIPNGSYNPVRAGFMKLTFKAIDVFGQKRKINIKELRTAASMTAYFNKKVVKDVIYVPTRLSQPSRLLFRWLAAIGTDFIQEMDALPSVTPVMGWIMPNHLDGSLFFYDQEGKPLGNLVLNGNNTAVVWQSAPGNDATIDQTVVEVFAWQAAPYKELALALSNAADGTGFFTSFYQAIDSMHNFINPENYAQNTELAILIGRPVAVVQAMLQLELSGGPIYNQSWAAVEKEAFSYDNAFTSVKFPVVLGDMRKVNDGLIGYFKQKDTGYDYKTFYAQSAKGENGVVKPVETTITLTAKTGSSATDAQRVLMLIDPRAAVHATMGILPTKAIDIPASMYIDTLSVLEMTFLVTPVLRGASGFQIPMPKEEGYQWSWVEEVTIPDGNTWVVDPEISAPTGQATYTYTPQQLTEGWLRLNPTLLVFDLLNAEGKPATKSSSTVSLTLRLTNKKQSRLQFNPGQLIAENLPNPGAVIYLFFGDLVDQADVPALQISSSGWQFSNLQSPYYGSYWAATPVTAQSLAANAHLVFQLTNVKTSAQTGQVQVFFDYLHVTGVNDGADSSIITTEK